MGHHRKPEKLFFLFSSLWEGGILHTWFLKDLAQQHFVIYQLGCKIFSKIRVAMSPPAQTTINEQPFWKKLIFSTFAMTFFSFWTSSLCFSHFVQCFFCSPVNGSPPFFWAVDHLTWAEVGGLGDCQWSLTNRSRCAKTREGIQGSYSGPYPPPPPTKDGYFIGILAEIFAIHNKNSTNCRWSPWYVWEKKKEPPKDSQQMNNSQGHFMHIYFII